MNLKKEIYKAMNAKEENLISRREAIKKAALVFGGVVSTPVALTLMQGCSPARTSADSFSDAERATLEAIADIIIPETDTPGATEAGAVQLMEDILFNINGEEAANDFLEKLAAFEQKAEQELGVQFVLASPKDQTSFVQKIHDETFGGEVDWDAPRPFIWQMKEGIVNSYLGTEVGITQVHQYIQAPGRYDPCIPFEEAGEGRLWTTHT